jgi:hypothetical protein
MTLATECEGSVPEGNARTGRAGTFSELLAIPAELAQKDACHIFVAAQQFAQLLDLPLRKR